MGYETRILECRFRCFAVVFHWQPATAAGNGFSMMACDF